MACLRKIREIEIQDASPLLKLRLMENEENLFDRADYRLSQADTLSLNFGFTRSWFQTPNSYDAQNATGWNGLVLNNGGLGPNGLPVGIQLVAPRYEDERLLAVSQWIWDKLGVRRRRSRRSEAHGIR